MKRISLIEQSLGSCQETFKLVGVVPQKELPSCYLRVFNGYVSNHGKREAVRQMKALYNELLRASCGLRIIPSTPIWCKRDRDGFPILLKPFKKYLYGSNLERRNALSLLRAFESIKLAPVSDLGTVTSPSQGESRYRARLRSSFQAFLQNGKFSSHIKDLFEAERSRLCKENIGIPFHFSTKRGIEGPTSLTAGKQSLAIKEDLAEILARFTANFRKGDWLGILKENQRYFSDHKDLYQTTDTSSTYLGRIAFIPAPGGKTRIVAIGNYWIQDCLKGLHDTLYRVLRRIRCDGTYDQESQAERVKTQSGLGPVWSYDLTAATDRLILLIQRDVLEFLNKQIGSDWGEILNRIVFTCQGKEVTYAVGQPMGLYSSWAVFALTHHFIVQYCAWLEKEKYPFESYAVLGDDVAIWSRRTAERYESILEVLDLEISKSKSFVPDDPSPGKPCIAEFAKRVFVKGEEISPIAPEIMIESWKSYYAFPEFIRFLDQHNLLVESVPVSRIAKMLKLTSKQLERLVCLFRIKEILGTPLRVNLDIPNNPKIDLITKEIVVRSRCELLAEQAADLWGRLFDFADESEQMLENHLDGPIPDNLYFRRILDTRVQAVMELENRLVAFLPKEDYDVYFEEELETESQALPEVSDIEYLPKIDPDEILNLCRGQVRHRVYRGRYIRQLLEKLGKELPI